MADIYEKQSNSNRRRGGGGGGGKRRGQKLIDGESSTTMRYGAKKWQREESKHNCNVAVNEYL